MGELARVRIGGALAMGMALLVIWSAWYVAELLLSSLRDIAATVFGPAACDSRWQQVVESMHGAGPDVSVLL